VKRHSLPLLALLALAGCAHHGATSKIGFAAQPPRMEKPAPGPVRGRSGPVASGLRAPVPGRT